MVLLNPQQQQLFFPIKNSKKVQQFTFNILPYGRKFMVFFLVSNFDFIYSVKNRMVTDYFKLWHTVIGYNLKMT